MSFETLLTNLDAGFDNILQGGPQEVFKALAVLSAEFLVLMGGGSLAIWAGTIALRGLFSLDGFLSFVIHFVFFYFAVSGGAH